MIYQIVRRKIILLLSVVSLAGCSAIPSERNGPEIDVFPVTTALSINTKESSTEAAEAHIKRFINDNKETFLNRDVVLASSSKDAQKLVDFTRHYLFSLGVDHLKVKEAPNVNLSSRSFDFQIEVTSFEVSTVACEKVKVGEYFKTDNGCFSENMRWKSMIAPERMLPNHAWHGE